MPDTWRARLLRRGLAVASIATSAACASTVVAHTLLRADLSAVRDPISAYAHGAYGYLQAGVFLAIGLASIALALALWLLPSPRSGHGWSHTTACISIGLWGVAMLACSVVDTDDPILGRPGNLHDLIVQTGFVVLVAGMLLVACARSRCRVRNSLQRISRPWAAASIAILTLAARAQHEAWFGLAERLLALCVVSWLIAVGLRLFRTSKGISPVHRTRAWLGTEGRSIRGLRNPSSGGEWHQRRTNRLPASPIAGSNRRF